MSVVRERLHALLVGLGVATASLAVTAVGLELAVRWISPQDLHRDEGLWAPDPERAFRLTPGFRGYEVASEFRVPITINSRGLRDREITPAKAPGTVRILVLGDSFTYGSGVAAEHTYPKRLEGLLAEQAGPRVEVINAGVSGYGTFHEAAFLQAEGWSYHPDLLIVQVFPDNDLDENLEPFDREVAEGTLRMRDVGPSGPAWLRGLKAGVRGRSHAYRLLGDRYHLIRIRLGLVPAFSAALGVYQRQEPRRVAAGWDATQRYLRGIAAQARERRLSVLVVYAPKDAALDSARGMAFAGFYRVSSDELDWELPGRTLGAFCAAIGVRYLDLAARFRATGRPLEFYYPHNGHWNAAGHDQVARWILETLTAQDGVIARLAQPPTPR